MLVFTKHVCLTGKNTGVGSSSFLQGIFPTQGLNSGLLYCRQILYRLSHQGSPRILEWVAYSFSRGSSQPRNQSVCLVAQSCPTLCDPMDLYSPWNSLGQNNGVGSLSLLQGTFPTQGLNPSPLHCRKILYQLSHK